MLFKFGEKQLGKHSLSLSLSSAAADRQHRLLVKPALVGSCSIFMKVRLSFLAVFIKAPFHMLIRDQLYFLEAMK